MRLLAALTATGLTAACAIGVAGGGASYSGPGVQSVALNISAPRIEARQPRWPVDSAIQAAKKLATDRAGVVSFAAIGPGGRTVGFHADRAFFSASVTKSMLLVAELRRLRREGLEVDEATRSLLNAMITASDNAAADAIYARVGDAGLEEVAKATGMSGFDASVGHWSNAKVTAGDLTLFMSKLDTLLDLPAGDAGSAMLEAIVPYQRWGIPEAASPEARVRFKGGWRPSETGELVHQAARVDLGPKSYSLAVLTDGNPSMPYGEETIRQIAEELLKTRPSRDEPGF